MADIKKEIKIKFTQRREGDVAKLFTNPTKAEKELDWRTEYDLFRMCEDAWRWLVNNPNGYKKNKYAPKKIQAFLEPLILFVRDDIISKYWS